MVYGELIQAPQVNYAKLLTSVLGEGFNNVYFVNSGSEAIEGAIKLARKATGRYEIISFNNAYHGSTLGSLSIMGGYAYKKGYFPLIPGTRQLRYNCAKDLSYITGETACVIVEPVQAEAGVILPENNFLSLLRARCHETGTLLVFDEIQTGFGRTGLLFSFQDYAVVPDIIVLAKSLGGGMPLGAFVSRKELMDCLSHNPPLGHITTFGGHPVSCAAGFACLQTIISEKLHESVIEKENHFRKYLSHPAIKEIRGKGLLLAVELDSSEIMHKTVKKAVDTGLLTDWFLFCDTAVRISPPLIITTEEIELSCRLLISAIEEACNEKN
jgi:acetylornithine/succinyldiaminopimelate/putrescine aminotransferase